MIDRDWEAAAAGEEPSVEDPRLRASAHVKTGWPDRMPALGGKTWAEWSDEMDAMAAACWG